MRQLSLLLVAVLSLATGCRQQPPRDLLRQPREAVLQWGPEVLTTLEQALADDDPLIRAKAIVRLGVWVGRKGSPEQKATTAETLARALADDQPSVRTAALNALGQIGPQAIPALRKGLEHEDPEMRAVAVASVVNAARGGTVKSSINREDFVAMMQTLRKAFLDDDPQVRASVVHGLGFLGVRGTGSKFLPIESRERQVGAQSRQLLIQMLEEGLDDEAVEVCQEAGVSLWQFGPDTGSLLEEAFKSESTAVRRGVLLAIAELPMGPAAIQRIVPSFSQRDRPSDEEQTRARTLVESGLRDEDLLVRLAAAETAIVFEPNEVRSEVIAVIGEATERGDPDLWQHVLRRLADHVAQKGTSQQKTQMTESLEKSLPEVDRSAAETIFWVYSKVGREAIPTLERVAGGDDPDMPMMAVGCLNQMFEPSRLGYEASIYATNFNAEDEAKAMRVIEQALKDEDLETQLSAAEAGMKLRSQPPHASLVSVIEKALQAEEADLATQHARIESVAVYVGRRGASEQKEAIVRTLEDVADNGAPEVKATAESALRAIRRPRDRS